MAWQTPKTNWAANDKCTVDDMNRIVNNIQFLIDGQDATFSFTSNDIVTLAQWQDIINRVVALCDESKIDYMKPSTFATYNNFNIVEGLIRDVKALRDRIPNMAKYNHYAGQRYYAGSGINSGGYY